MMSPLDSPTPPLPHSHSPTPSPKLGRLLIVDDESKLLTALCEMLGEQGYETAGFASAQAALEALKGRDFDLLLTDLMMPEMDGIALLRAALDIDPNLISIVMTGQGTIQTAVEAMKVGAFDYILKPFKLRALLPTLSRAMQVRHLRADNIQLRETVGIYELSLAIAFALDANTILSKAADAAVQQCGADEASILLPTPTGNELYIAVARGERPRPILGERVPIEGTIAGWVVRQQEPLTLAREVKDPRFAPLVPRPEIRAAVSMPMLVGGDLVGVLNINATQGRGFRLGQVKALNILATIAASALKNAQLYGQVREAEEKYRSLFENAAEGIFRTTPEGRYIAANPAMARILGYDSPAELMAAVTNIGRQLYVDPERRAEFERLLETQAVLRGFEAQLYRKDGSTVWVSEHVRVVRDASGALRSYEGISEDITDRKRAEEELRRHVERLKGLREIDQAILGAHFPQAIAEAALQRIRHLVPYQRASVMVFDYETREAITVATQDVDQTGLSRIGRGALEDFRIAELQQGKIHVVEDTMNLSRPMPVIQALQAEGVRSYLNVPLIAQAALIGALYVGADSPGAFTPEHMEISQEVANQLAIAILQARLHEQVQRHTVQLEQRVAARTADLAAANEQLAAASRHKSEFLANMSHELRTPLNSVLGFAQLLLEQTGSLLSEKQTRYLTNIYNSGKHLLQLISDILDISKVEAGKFVLQPEPLPVAETLEDILVIGRGLAHKKAQTIQTEIVPDLPPVHADPVRFKQILFNLLSNAVKFTPDGGRITLTARRVDWSNGQRVDSSKPIDQLTARPIDSARDWLEVAVRDTGVGIKPEDLPRLFREFIQLETTQAQRYEGTGLGLALTKKLVELHAGRIWAASEGVGRGSTFTILLPFAGREN